MFCEVNTGRSKNNTMPVETNFILNSLNSFVIFNHTMEIITYSKMFTFYK